ncbi:hypothetical protein GCM10022240_30560 [Microbacterium kribbense]|uniref:DUF3180 domain-containing protein n=1 Tax=Microbacterium kribbense TaxID=433645 RepID=A0ABP7GZD5_9MICO
MRRTGPGALIVAGILGGGAGYLLDQLLTASGRPTFTPMFTLPVMLLVVGACVIVLALPIYRATHGHATAPVNPFRAVRIAVLAKASSLVGAVFTGFGLGLLTFILSRPADPSASSVSALIATIVCAAVLIAAGLIAEHLCTIRKDDDDTHPGAESGAGHHPGADGVDGSHAGH